MASLLKEIGIHYSRQSVEGLVCFAYKWKHHPTKKRGVTKIWCNSRRDLLELLNRWNQAPDWTYCA